MENNFPIFPKVGYHVRFLEDLCLWSGSEVEVGTVGEVVGIKILDDHQETKIYLIYLGLACGTVLEVNYTVHKDKMEIIPSTKAAQVLYGNT